LTEKKTLLDFGMFCCVEFPHGDSGVVLHIG